jgi:hypothetical protein
MESPIHLTNFREINKKLLPQPLLPSQYQPMAKYELSYRARAEYDRTFEKLWWEQVYYFVATN